MYLIPIEQLVLPLACRGMVLKVRHPGMAEIMHAWCRVLLNLMRWVSKVLKLFGEEGPLNPPTHHTIPFNWHWSIIYPWVKQKIGTLWFCATMEPTNQRPLLDRCWASGKGIGQARTGTSCYPTEITYTQRGATGVHRHSHLELMQGWPVESPMNARFEVEFGGWQLWRRVCVCVHPHNWVKVWESDRGQLKVIHDMNFNHWI